MFYVYRRFIRRLHSRVCCVCFRVVVALSLMHRVSTASGVGFYYYLFCCCCCYYFSFRWELFKVYVCVNAVKFFVFVFLQVCTLRIPLCLLCNLLSRPKGEPVRKMGRSVVLSFAFRLYNVLFSKCIVFSLICHVACTRSMIQKTPFRKTMPPRFHACLSSTITNWPSNYLYTLSVSYPIHVTTVRLSVFFRYEMIKLPTFMQLRSLIISCPRVCHIEPNKWTKAKKCYLNFFTHAPNY